MGTYVERPLAGSSSSHSTRSLDEIWLDRGVDSFSGHLDGWIDGWMDIQINGRLID